jgi:hypothetical protein
MTLGEKMRKNFANTVFSVFNLANIKQEFYVKNNSDPSMSFE